MQVDLRTSVEVAAAFEDLSSRDDTDAVVVQEMIDGAREFATGLVRDPQFGPCVMFGLGGIYAEALDDVVFRIAPLTLDDARTQMASIRGVDLLGSARGAVPADREQIAAVLMALGQIGLDDPEISAVDVNPLMIRSDGSPVAADVAVWRVG